MKIISDMSLFILVNDYLHQIIKFNFAIRQYYALLSCWAFFTFKLTPIFFVLQKKWAQFLCKA